MKYIMIYVVSSMLCLKSSGQIVFDNIKDDHIIKTIEGLFDFLAIRPTDTTLNTAGAKPEQWKFYDEAINTYFNRSALSDKLSKVDFADMKVQYEALYNIDKIIDIVPLDSFFMIGMQEYYQKREPGNAIDFSLSRNRFFIGFLINGKQYPMMDIEMDGAGKLIFVMPMIYFDQDQGQVVTDFIKRWQNKVK